MLQGSPELPEEGPFLLCFIVPQTPPEKNSPVLWLQLPFNWRNRFIFFLWQVVKLSPST